MNSTLAITSLIAAVRRRPGLTAAELQQQQEVAEHATRHAVAALLPEIEQQCHALERGVPRLCAVTQRLALTWHPVSWQ